MKLINFNLSVEKSPIHGWGIFVNEFIHTDTVIIQSPGILLRTAVRYPTELMYYFYPCDGNFILALGYASLINSSKQPNVCFDVDAENKLVNIKSIQPIQPGEEITLNYL